MNQRASKLTSLDKVIFYSQGFAASGRQLPNPVESYNEELNASLRNGEIRSESRMGRMSDAAFNQEREDVATVARVYWHGESGLRAEELLRMLLKADYPIVRPDDDLQKIMLTVFGGREACDRFLRVAFRRQSMELWQNTLERQMYMVRPEEVLDSFDCMFCSAFMVTNPLVALRSVEDDSYAYWGSTRSRERMLASLEGLSRRLWHMATTVDVETLRARIVLQSNSGADDLALLEQYRELMNIPVPIEEEPLNVDCDDGLADLLF